ncbi:MAG: 50S ribosomal protein L28 [Candidatus Peregrinibacteria bacterium]|nr:50S ribosomal protein L28 [Candidatus Peregrinibacteria bacterium]MDZ4245216.1 50S ribosomal protein L28 [Candidatus Gracilibacteria bacterium]
MSKICPITGKRPSTGNNRSHSNRATKRRFLPNLIVKRIYDPITKTWKKMRISVNALKTLTKRMK